MSFMEHFTREFRDEVLIVRVTIPKTSLQDALEFQEYIESDIILGYERIVVDLSNCEVVDATFLGVLVIASKKISEYGGKMKLVLPPQVFIYTGVKKIFHTYLSSTDAVTSFNFGRNYQRPENLC
jgi:anti-anti-sigma regulatory factor